MLIDKIDGVKTRFAGLHWVWKVLLFVPFVVLLIVLAVLYVTRRPTAPPPLASTKHNKKELAKLQKQREILEVKLEDIERDKKIALAQASTIRARINSAVRSGNWAHLDAVVDSVLPGARDESND